MSYDPREDEEPSGCVLFLAALMLALPVYLLILGVILFLSWVDMFV